MMRRQPSVAPVAPPDDPIHLLNPDERLALERIERRAIWHAAAAGALSALASAIASIVTHVSHPIDGIHVSWHNIVTYWGWVGAVTIVASVFEIGFLYWDALRSVHRMACAAGLQIDDARGHASDSDVVTALARAALELPNPPKPLEGIDPRRETNPLIIIAASLLYKAKVALTTFILKALVRSALGRAAARAMLDLIAVPVTALWNGLVCYYVLREARLRILGPSAVVELVTEGLEVHRVSHSGWRVAARAVASAVVRTGDFHPNHLALVHALSEHVSVPTIEELDDTRRFIQEIRDLDDSDQRFVLQVLVIAAILDGRVTRRERRLLEQAFAASQRQLVFAHIADLVRTFRAGQPILAAIRAVVP